MNPAGAAVLHALQRDGARQKRLRHEKAVFWSRLRRNLRTFGRCAPNNALPRGGRRRPLRGVAPPSRASATAWICGDDGSNGFAESQNRY
jgi:IS5 family transposase